MLVTIVAIKLFRRERKKTVNKMEMTTPEFQEKIKLILETTP